MQWIEQNEFIKELENGTDMLLLDVRPEEDFIELYLKGSVPTYLMEVEDPADRLDILKDIVFTAEATPVQKPVVVLCRSGNTGARQTWIDLESMGYPMEHVYLLVGGVNRWPHAHDKFVVRKKYS